MVKETKSIWKPQFIEEINSDICLDCDRFYEVGGSNALRLRSLGQDGNDVENHVMTIANPEQCADCNACTSTYSGNYAHYSFSV